MLPAFFRLAKRGLALYAQHMQHLIVMRHAKAASEAEYAFDRERPLTARGLEDARAAGRHLAQIAEEIAAPANPLRVLISPSLRTRETWAALAPALPHANFSFEDKLYMAPAEAIWEIAMAAGAPACLIIAHNPGLHHLVQVLLTQAHDHSGAARALLQSFPTSTFAVFALSGEVLEAAGPRLIASNGR